MPRAFLFTKEEIVAAALDLTREHGISAVTARAMGEKLGVSTRPVFSYFDSMDDVRRSVVEAANELFAKRMQAEMESGKYPPYKASGMAYIRFAKEERELFKLLYMRDRRLEEKKIDPSAEKLVDLIVRQVHITRARAWMFYLEMWAYVHGIATMAATGFYDWSEDLASESLTDMYLGLKYKYEHKD